VELTEFDGDAEKESLAAGPAPTVNDVVVADVSPLDVALSVYVPALPIEQPANVATPATADRGLVVQVRVAPAGVVIARLTEAVEPVVKPVAS
jgi:hypothetical protein